MIRRWRHRVKPLALVFSLLAAPASAELPLAYLLQSDDGVEVRREAWESKVFRPTSVGAALNEGDFLRLASDAQAVVLCSDFKTPPQRPHPGEDFAVEKACPRLGNLLELPDGLSIAPRLADTKGLSVLSPRGKIRKHSKEALVIRWAAPPLDRQEFDVRLLRGSRPIWGWLVVHRKTEWQVPDEVEFEPDIPFWPEVRYRQQIYTPEMPFRLIDETTQKEIGRLETALLNLMEEAPRGARDLAQVLFLAHQQLLDEALRLLESSVLAPTSATTVLAGRLAIGLGLTQHAEERFAQACQLARIAGDLDSEATALLLLGSIVGDKRRADELLESALAIYEQLGDAARLEEARHKLSSSGRR